MPQFTSFDHENYNSSSVLNYQDLNDYIPDDYIDSNNNQERFVITEPIVDETNTERTYSENDWVCKIEPIRVAPEFTPDENADPTLYQGSMNDIKRDLAAWTFKNQISGNAYESLVKLINRGLAKAQSSAKDYSISMTSFNDLKKNLEESASDVIKLPFTDKRILVEEIEDVPIDWKREIDDQIGEIHFSYRNIKDVCQLLFSHSIFWKVMINQPSIYKQNGERVFLDIDSGEFWEELQLRFPDNIILSIILASDQTVISGNGRHKAWPLYLKLGMRKHSYEI
ncbi:hypothetical protein INT45_008918 [Circinella minor]|uniref:Uncharacterized protein n=1 Tax=Circinella minor TaxID=1195481 RepID=A0A8H7VH01_9FUNG|nr:hypothetical protein INT45_008918 [Circinella minor]